MEKICPPDHPTGLSNHAIGRIACQDCGLHVAEHSVATQCSPAIDHLLGVYTHEHNLVASHPIVRTISNTEPNN